MLKGGGGAQLLSDASVGDALLCARVIDLQGLREKLASSEQLMAQINRSWEEKLRQSERIREENQRMLEYQGVARDLRKIENRLPNLVNLNEDPQLSEMLIYIIKVRKKRVPSSIGLDSVSFASRSHCTFTSTHTHAHTHTHTPPPPPSPMSLMLLPPPPTPTATVIASTPPPYSFHSYNVQNL